MGKVLRDSGVKIFQIETTLNTDTFPSPFEFLAKREWEWTARDRALYLGTVGRTEADAEPDEARRLPGHPVAPPDDERAGRRGGGRPQDDDGERLPPAARAGGGPDRHPHDGDPLHLPLQRELDHEPDPRDVHGARLLLQHVPREAPRARGRRADPDPPDAVGVPPGAPPELHRLLRAGAGRHDRPGRDRAALREVVRRGRVVPAPLPHVLRLPRRAPVLHVVLGLPRPGARRAGDHRRRRTAGGAPARLRRRRRRWTTPSRWPPTSSAATPRSPTSTTRRS